MQTIYLTDKTSILDVYRVKFGVEKCWIFSHTADDTIVIDIKDIDRIE